MSFNKTPLLKKMASLEKRLAEFEDERSAQSKNMKRLTGLLGFVGVVTLLFYGGQAISDPDSPLACLLDSNLYCFRANTPAKATQVNHNFAAIETEINENFTTLDTAIQNKVDKAGDTITGGLNISGGVTSSNIKHYSGEMPAGGTWYNLFAPSGARNYLIIGTLGGTDCTTGSVVAHLDYSWSGATGVHVLTLMNGVANRIRYNSGYVQINFRRLDVNYGRYYNFSVITQP